MTDPKARIAIIGLGNMGTPMAQRWIAAGYPVHGFDLNPEALKTLSSVGGQIHTSAASAVAQASVCVLMLPNSSIVEAVIEELRDDAFARSPIVIDMSSSEPTSSQRIAESLAPSGIKFIDAPVSGGVRGAVAGTLTIMAGGNAETVDDVRPLLECLGEVTHVGPVGAGHGVKALNNLLSAAHLWLTSEAVVIAKKLGVDAQTMLDVLNSSSGRSGSSEQKWPRFILPGTFDSGFEARLMLKDAKIATHLATELGVPSSLGEEVVNLWEEAGLNLPKNADHTEIAKFIEMRRKAMIR